VGLLYAVLADLVLAVHFAFVAFVVLGGLLTWRWPKVRPWHLAAVAWGAFVALTNRVCPLTPLENDFLVRAGRAGHEHAFLDRYLAPLVYPEGLTPALQAALGLFVLGWNALVYWLGWRRRRSPPGADDVRA
jgi:hypothetical protein